MVIPAINAPKENEKPKCSAKTEAPITVKITDAKNISSESEAVTQSKKRSIKNLPTTNKIRKTIIAETTV